MSKVVIDKNSCVGCGLCVNNAPDCFEMSEDGVAKVKEGCDTSNIQEIITQCPVNAITIEE